MKAVAVLVHLLIVTVLDESALDLFGGLKSQRQLDPVGNRTHVHLGHRGALAGMDILGGDDNSELAVDFDDIAFAERAGDDFHGFLDDGWPFGGTHGFVGRHFAVGKPVPNPVQVRSGAFFRTCAVSGRTIPILSLIARYFRGFSSTRLWRSRRPKLPPHRPFGTRRSMPTAGRSCWRAAGSLQRCGSILPGKASSRSRLGRC